MKRKPDDGIAAALVREALASATDQRAGECLDAATAAAWADGRLDRAARRAVEEHSARCARCQGLLAALVRTGPAPAAERWWRQPAARWLLPAAVAASAVAVWIAVPRPQPLPSRAAVDSVSRNEIASPHADAPGPAPASPSLQAETRQTAKQKKSAAADELRESVDSRSLDTAASAAKPSNLAAPQAMAKSAVGGFVASTIASPDPAVAWRLVPAAAATVVERTSDGGRTWQPAAAPGTSVSSGASPAANVCWLVGPSGTVLVTSDAGATWQRLSAPDPADLATVTALDATTATVTTVDGRRFSTNDSGRSWSPSSE